MKFERQRIAPGISNKVQVNNQQFLTFRVPPPLENSGRSVYSQQFDYRSVEKCPKEQDINQTNGNFRKNIKNVRSQDKYRQLQQEAAYYMQTDENGETANGTLTDRNEDLMNRLTFVVKNIKRAQKKQMSLQEEISRTEGYIEQNNQQIFKYKADIQELSQISQDNLKNYSEMVSRIQAYEQRAKYLSERLGFVDNQLQNEARTGRSRDGSSSQLLKKLQQGLKDLQQMDQNLQSQIGFFDEEIEVMEQRLKQMRQIDKYMKSLS